MGLWRFISQVFRGSLVGDLPAATKARLGARFFAPGVAKEVRLNDAGVAVWVDLAAGELHFAGAWDNGTDYVSGDLVTNGGSTWLALRGVDSGGAAPAEGADWTVKTQNRPRFVTPTNLKH